MSQPFNPIYGMPTKFYHDLQTADAAYKTLPGNTLAMAQNDGIGAVLDIKRYRERGANEFATALADFTLGAGAELVGDEIVLDLNEFAYAPFVFGDGKLYEVRYEGSGTAQVRQATSGTGSTYTQVTLPASVLTVGSSTATNPRVQIVGTGAGCSLTGVSVREIPGYHAIQSLATAQPVLNIENGVRSALFDGVDDRLVIPNSTDQFNFLHNGQGGELHVCARVTDMSADRMLAANNGGSSAGVGIDLRIRPNGVVRFAVTRGIAGEQSALNLPAGSAVVGEIAVWGIRYDAGTLRIYKNGVEVGATAQSYPPVAADAPLDLTIGGPQPGSGTFSGDIYSVAPVQGILSDYQRQRLATYMLRRAGV